MPRLDANICSPSVEIESRSLPSELREQQVSDNPREFRLGLAFNRMRNYQFVGRKRTLLRLDRILHGTFPDGNSRLAVLYGTGGVGKTQIALEYAYLSRSKYSAVFWIDGSSKDSALLSVKRCLERILSHYTSFGGAKPHPRYWQVKEALDRAEKVENSISGSPKSEPLGNSWPPKAEQFQVLAEAFIDWLSHDNNGHWLIILDNVDDIESFDFRELVPVTGNGAVVVTTRRSDLAVKWDAIEVTEMDADEAINLLAAITKLDLRGEHNGLSRSP